MIKDQHSGIENKNDHIAYIDGCRGIAIMIVVLAHAGLGQVIPGKFGVTLFFFISGYLITKLLLLELKKTGHIRIGNFYLRRFFRLYPALLTMILSSILLGSILLCPLPANDILSSLFYFTNYYVGWIRPEVPDCYRLLDIIWSLSVEEHFYFFFPFLAAFLLGATAKASGRKIFRLVMFALCFIAFACRCWLYFRHLDDLPFVAGRVYFSTHTRMDSILWGCIASFLLFDNSSGSFRQLFNRKLYFYLGLLLLFLSVAVRADMFRQTLLFSFQGLGLMLTIPALSFPGFQKLRKVLEWKGLLLIGRLSYSLYLFHWGASKLANNLYEEHSLHWQLVFWPVTIAATLFSYYCVEKPFIRLRRRFGSEAKG